MVTPKQGLRTYVRDRWFSNSPRGTIIPSCVIRDSFSGLGLPTTLAYRRLRTYLPTPALRTTPAYSTYTTSGDRLLLDSSSADTLIPCGQKDPSSGLLDLASLPAVHLRSLTTPVRSSPVRPHVSRVAPSALAAVLCSQNVDNGSMSSGEADFTGFISMQWDRLIATMAKWTEYVSNLSSLVSNYVSRVAP